MNHLTHCSHLKCILALEKLESTISSTKNAFKECWGMVLGREEHEVEFSCAEKRLEEQGWYH